jgi:VanZ family protein
MEYMLQRSLKNPRLWQVALICFWLALFVATHIPVERLVLNPGAKDKLVHTAAYAVLTLLFATTWRLSAGRFNLHQTIWVWCIVMLYAAFEETTQPLVNRSASLVDWLADALGATLGLAVFWIWPRRWLNRHFP